MAKRKRTRKATRSHTPRTTHRKTGTRRRRRRSTGLSAGFKSAPFKSIGAGAIGGAGYALATSLTGGSPIWNGIIGLAGSFALGYFNLPNVGTGVAGATGADLTRNLFGLSENMESTEYVPENVGVDDDGNVFALSEGGQPMEYLGNVVENPELQDVYDLSGAFDLSDGEQSVMMIPTYMQ